ncbi:hypothetical protein XENTR_v10003472 [Xenopus tropicalis]|nr:hypothetical protein XENTR_v10003472 [Xenopus tropicalis]
MRDVLRVKVIDNDTPQTPAWRAKYKIISGNEKGNYNLTTDPVTNEGILSVQKPLDFEGTPFKKVVITAENEEPLFSCQNSKVKINSSPVLGNVTINIQVLDNNDAPVFKPQNVALREKEGVKPGTVLLKLNATDPDRVPNNIRFYVANDPAGWVTVDEKTGVITTKKELDRESPYVNKTLYAFVIHGVDDGDPPQTGSTTVSLLLADVNDNTPFLLSPYMEACEQLQASSAPGPRSFSVHAHDKDLDPYSGPFQFELADNSPDTTDNWKIGRTNPDDSVELVMLRNLPKGNYSVPLNVYDRQGTLEAQTLHIRICSCPDGQTCEKPQPPQYLLGPGAIGIIFLALLLFLVGFCFLFSAFCINGRNKGLGLNEEGNQTLIQYNEEGGGSITKAAPVLLTSNGNLDLGSKDGVAGSAAKQHVQNPSWNREGLSSIHSAQSNMWKRSLGSQSQAGNSSIKMNGKYLQSGYLKSKPLGSFIDSVGEMVTQRLQGLDNYPEIPTYKPRVYAYEGELERIDSLGSFSIAESELDWGFLDDLDPKFAKLEEICRQPL